MQDRGITEDVLESRTAAEPNTMLQTKLRHLPVQPGVYLFKDEQGEILYIGKAKSLRARVRSYFARGQDPSLKTRELVRRVVDVDTIVVGSEVEALLLEANLIKTHRPRFNIQLRDDKRYPYIKVTTREPFPRVFVTRRLEDDGARYFGPYTDVRPMRQALEVIKRLYTVRSCRYALPHEAPSRPCLDYHIGLCKAPCMGLQSESDYREMVDEILEILSGRTERIKRRVEKDMEDASEALDFERAAVLRDVVTGLEAIGRRQRMADVRGGDQDVIGVARDGDRACAVVLRIRGGTLLGREVDFFENIRESDDPELVSAIASRFYLGRGEDARVELPREVLFGEDFEDRMTVEALLAEAAGRRVRTHVPHKGDKVRLVELANQNARHLLEERAVLTESIRDRADDALYDLQEALGLKIVPRLIACFDVSHTQGSEVVGSAVVFENGEPKKSEYRRFKIRGDWGNDDYRSMAEVVGRYVRRRVEEEQPLPDLIIVDGGKGQLGAATSTLEEHGLADVAVCALAERDEEVYLVGRSDPLRLPRSNVALRLLQRARNEAHRFAHGYNRNLRRRRTLTSELEQVPGIGPKRRLALLKRFGSVRAIRAAEVDEIVELPGFSHTLAQTIIDHLKR